MKVRHNKKVHEEVKESANVKNSCDEDKAATSQKVSEIFTIFTQFY